VLATLSIKDMVPSEAVMPIHPGALTYYREAGLIRWRAPGIAENNDASAGCVVKQGVASQKPRGTRRGLAGCRQWSAATKATVAMRPIRAIIANIMLPSSMETPPCRGVVASAVEV
jgi:hypothetical protein